MFNLLDVDHLCQFAAMLVYPFSKFHVHKFDLFWPPMTLTFDLLTPNDDRFMLLLRGPLVAICIEIGFVCFQNDMFTKVTDRWTSGQVENFMPPASLN